jgi:hypothetical protein
MEADDLVPCRYCGGGENRFDDNLHWTGQRYQFVNTHLRHWCEREGERDFNQLVVDIRAHTREQAAEMWRRLNNV